MNSNSHMTKERLISSYSFNILLWMWEGKRDSFMNVRRKKRQIPKWPINVVSSREEIGHGAMTKADGDTHYISSLKVYLTWK